MSARRPLDVPIERWTLVEALRLQAARLGEAEFLTFDGGAGGPTGAERLTFAELDRLSDAAAGALAALGVEPGDRVLALATNSKAFLVAMLGAHKRRAVFTPVNTELKGPFLAHQVRNSRPRVVVVGGADRGAAREGAEQGGEADVEGEGRESAPGGGWRGHGSRLRPGGCRAFGART